MTCWAGKQTKLNDKEPLPLIVNLVNVLLANYSGPITSSLITWNLYNNVKYFKYFEESIQND